jgi:O-methyltransferase involved in polyketide biosynthesis
MHADDQPDELVIDMSRAHPARVYDYWLGGKDNFAADRELGDAVLAELPDVRIMAQANRHFLRRVVRHLVVDRGVEQFLDVGSGIPTACNTHQIAQSLALQARVVYVDNDPIVAAHSHALLASTTGRVVFALGDATRPADIVAHPVLGKTFDRDRPVAVLLVSVLMYFPDAVARHIVTTLLKALPAGSFVAISHPTADFAPEATARAIAVARQGGLTYIPRSYQQLAALLGGLDLLEPGIVPMLDWRPDSEPTAIQRNPYSVYYWVALARSRLVPHGR